MQHGESVKDLLQLFETLLLLNVMRMKRKTHNCLPEIILFALQIYLIIRRFSACRLGYLHCSVVVKLYTTIYFNLWDLKSFNLKQKYRH